MSFFENWKAFLVAAEKQRLSTASQAAFYWIIAKFNAANWAEEIDLSDRELMRLTQIRSTKTITDAKSRLKLSGLIDFRTSKHYGTTYKLVQLATAPWCETQSDTQSNTQGKAQGETQGSTQPSVSYTHVGAEDTKTARRERLQDSGGGVAGAHAGGSDGGDGTKKPSEEVKNVFVGFFHLMDWNDECVLSDLEKKYGKEMLIEAITTAFTNKHARDKNLLAYIKGILTNKKGAKKNGANSKDANTDNDAKKYYDLC